MARYLTAKQFGEELQVTTYTILSWARQGIIPEVRVSRNIHRFELDGVIDAVKKRDAERPEKSKSK